jgi:lipoprotein-anchoring transpeptidase ErfK/SrfK
MMKRFSDRTVMRRFSGGTLLPLIAAAALAGCTFSDRTDDDDAGAPAPPPAAGTQQAPPPPPVATNMQIEVDIGARQLHVLRDGQRVESHPVAVGSSEWPTPTGEWTIGQVIFNPRWIPPEEEWAKDEKVSEPGDPDNPLGRAQLVYAAPNSIHGTNDPSSLGQAVSHGSIRVSNEVAEQLARQVMEAGGAPRDDAFFQRARSNRTERVEVSIPNPVPIRVVRGG